MTEATADAAAVSVVASSAAAAAVVAVVAAAAWPVWSDCSAPSFCRTEK